MELFLETLPEVQVWDYLLVYLLEQFTTFQKIGNKSFDIVNEVFLFEIIQINGIKLFLDAMYDLQTAGKEITTNYVSISLK